MAGPFPHRPGSAPAWLLDPSLGGPPGTSRARAPRRAANIPTTMEYLIDFLIAIPDGASPGEVRERLDGEGTRVAELAAEGKALRVWRPLPDDGRQRALGLYRAASDAELEAILDSLPLRPWMEITVTPLAAHPNDPGARGSYDASVLE
jgi:muconolactone D-isomerase